MTLEALPSNELPAFLIYDTINAAAAAAAASSSRLLFNGNGGITEESPLIGGMAAMAEEVAVAAGEGRRKRRRRARSGKSKDDAESQRMTHIAVERNRRRLMNEHLAVLRSLTPDSYVQKGDQASIVGGAIDFVKELEQLLQSLEAQKRTLLQQQQQQQQKGNSDIFPTACYENDSPPFAQFFSYPQYAWCHPARDYPSLEIQHRPATVAPSVADIEVSLIETHANIRILTARQPGQLLKMVAGIQSLRLTILHLNVTVLDAIVLYSLSVKNLCYRYKILGSCWTPIFSETTVSSDPIGPSRPCKDSSACPVFCALKILFSFYFLWTLMSRTILTC
ncbi:transcription factor bHLH94-like isoform X1 [Ananas comosus]|uniref:Transcription factor bHLH94-like isoform X1 n=1 Tax=Ananas comosus TaxID=4615 RepID=A0A6P5EBJ3_ANACO|nr:transcription factor bHLH94-like isoform X1 [Ananas comosus]